MFRRAFRKHTNRIAMWIAMVVLTCALLCDEGGENLPKQVDPANGIAQIMAVDSPMVRIESTDEVSGAILQAIVVRRLTVRNFKSKVVRYFFYAILDLLLTVVAFMLLQRPLLLWFHRSQRVIVSYIHDQDGQK